MKYEPRIYGGTTSRTNPSGPQALHENLPNAPRASKKRHDKRKSQRQARISNRK